MFAGPCQHLAGHNTSGALLFSCESRLYITYTRRLHHMQLHVGGCAPEITGLGDLQQWVYTLSSVAIHLQL